jgi:hypothetical protein
MVANVNTPFGLQPIRRHDGASWNNSLRPYLIPASYGQAIFVGDCVTKVAASANVSGINGINLTASGAGNVITGVVCGFEGVTAAGVGSGSGGSSIYPGFFPLAGTPGPIYRPASTSLDYYALVNDDPGAEFVVQATSDYGGTIGTVLPVAAVGKNANIIGPITTATGTWTAGNTTFTISSATGVLPGMSIASTSSAGGVPNPTLGIPSGTVITAVSGTTITVSQAFTATQGSATNLLINGGNVYTGWSGTQLDSSSVATTQNYQLNILRFLEAPNNTPASTYAKVVVRINQATEAPNTAGI